VTKTVTPPPPFASRPRPKVVTLTEPFDDELSKRLALHALADLSLSGVLAPGDRRHVPPSRRLYIPDLRASPRTAAARDAVVDAWRVRWFTARVLETQHQSLAQLLFALAAPLDNRPTDWAAQELAYYVGRQVHARIMAHYRQAYRANVVACDNRVYFPARTSRRLAELAREQPRSVYDGLNYCLAGQRCDIVDLSRREMWEIKPASMASAAVLQLWGYLDNYEVARVLAHYRREAPLPRFDVGVPVALPRQVLRAFELRIDRDTRLVVTPFAVSALPGLILYTVRVKRRRDRAQRAVAAQAVAVSDADIQEAMIAARRDLRDTIAEEDEDARTLIVISGVTVLVIIGIALIIVTAGAAAGPEAALVGGTGAVAGGVAAAEVATAGVAAEVISLAAYRAAAGVAVETIVAAAPRIAAGITIYLAGRELNGRPESAGLCIEAGCDVGEALGGAPPGL
jgi:hypothetical protein